MSLAPAAKTLIYPQASAFNNVLNGVFDEWLTDALDLHRPAPLVASLRVQPNIRGGIAHANEELMAGAEERQLPSLFKLRQTQNVARTIARLARNKKAKWQDSGRDGPEWGGSCGYKVGLGTGGGSTREWGRGTGTRRRSRRGRR